MNYSPADSHHSNSHHSMNISHSKLAARLRTDTAALAQPEGRRVGQPGHDRALAYLRGRLGDIGLVPFRGEDFALSYDRPHPNTGAMQRFTNLVGVVPGRNRQLAPLLLGAHYDSVIDAPCADDNATSVALNLAIAEAFLARPLERDLIVALFDAEEPPHFLGPTMGSRRFHEDHCRDIDFAGVVVSDLIGHDFDLADLRLGVPGIDLLVPHARKALFVLGAESDPVLPAIVEAAAAESRGLRVLPTLSRYIGGVSDHDTFERQGQPFLFLSCGQGRYYHDERDTLDWIHFDKLARITGFVARLLRGLDANPGQRGRPRVDPFDFERRMIRRAAGPAALLALKAMGRDLPASREEMDAMAGMLI